MENADRYTEGFAVARCLPSRPKERYYVSIIWTMLSCVVSAPMCAQEHLIGPHRLNAATLTGTTSCSVGEPIPRRNSESDHRCA